MYYAKSKPEILTIVEHTSDVVDAVEVLKSVTARELPFSEKEWELLRLAALYHDVGKYSAGFQSKIQGAVFGKNGKNNLLNYPHNYLSLALVPYDELRAQGYTQKDIILFVLAIGYHHEREKKASINEIKKIFDVQLSPYIKKIQEDFQGNINGKLALPMLTFLEKRTTFYRQMNDEMKRIYILLKGLLQRADRAASAKLRHEDMRDFIEKNVDANVGMETKGFIEKAFGGVRPLQQWAYDNRKKNIVLIAQTGSGKTEAALIWIDRYKGFITLPFRVSLNAMFDRVRDTKGISFPYVGLLHSTALNHLMLKDSLEKDSYEESMLKIQHTQRLAEKLTFSTIDQLFKFPLLYKGFEIELATFAYSKVVIDEIQAYEPKIVAILLQGLKMINDVGGKWMIMTATLPAIFVDSLKDLGLLGEKTLQKTILLDDDRHERTEVPRRHRIMIEEKSIEEMVEDILLKSTHSKVLVVVNTIAQAIALYDKLKEDCDAYLLHSLFIPLHRSKREQAILHFAQLSNDETGIWICTQIVEASLDVDFDYLYTEAATPDALFQRFGRCNRKGKRFNGEVPPHPNVFIASDLENVSGIDKIYEKKIVEVGLTMLQNLSNNLVDEEQKIQIVHETFSRESLAGTDYLNVFDKTFDDLRNLPPFELNNKEAQNILRDIQSVALVPGQENYEKVLALIEEYEEEKKQKNYLALQKINMEIEQYFVHVNKYRLKWAQEKENFFLNTFSNPDFAHVYFSTDVMYSEERGLEFKVKDDMIDIF